VEDILDGLTRADKYYTMLQARLCILYDHIRVYSMSDTIGVFINRELQRLYVSQVLPSKNVSLTGVLQTLERHYHFRRK
jgi:hypothetical protein